MRVVESWVKNLLPAGARAHGDDDDDELPSKRQRRPRPEPRSLSVEELIGSFAALLAAIAFLSYRISPDSFTEMRQLFAVFGVAVACLLLLLYSFSLVIILMVTAVLSFPLAQLLLLFFYFLSNNHNIWGYWLFTFLVSMTFGLSIWGQIQALKRERRWPDLPLWATSAVVTVLVVLAAFSLGFRQDREAEAKVAPSAPRTETRSVLPVGAGVAFPDQAVRQVLFAWKQRYEAGLARVAAPPVVSSILERDYDPSIRFESCGTPTGPQVTCTAKGAESSLTFHVQEYEASRYLVVGIE